MKVFMPRSLRWNWAVLSALHNRSPGRDDRMKRSELYGLVWAKPMTQLAAELGISDVGLAKACRRHAVPAPRAVTGPS